jgi:phosphoglycerate dehydrogenase-like enzyme
MKKYRIAILDDYQQVSTTYGDWTVIKDHADIAVFSQHIEEETQLVALLQPFDVLCVMRERTPMTATLLNSLPNLKLIVSTGQRNASIDLDAAAKKNIEVANTRYVSSGASELTWALLMAIARHIPQENAGLRNNGRWQSTIGSDLKGKTLGIIGLGNIGTKIADIARVFDMNVIAWSANLDIEKARLQGIRPVTKEELFSQSDYITIHLVLSHRTKGIVGLDDLRLMKPTAFLINTSRGPLVDEAALLKVLYEKAIAGAALDVFEEEPLPSDHPFRMLDNVLATPHIGFVTEETYSVFFNDTRDILQNWLEKHA